MDDCLAWFFQYLNQITICIALVIFGVHIVWHRSSAARLQIALGKALSSSGIPNGVAFLICALFPEHVVKMQGAFIAFLIGGLALFCITFFDVISNTPKPAA